jgi:hypothetical protein
MPGTFPAGAPVLTGDSLAISRFLNDPAAIQRRLRDFRDLRFLSDQLLTGRRRSEGGAVLYDQSEPFVTDRTVEAVSAGSEYPYANLPTGTAAIAAIQKWGQKVLLTDEELARNQYQGAAVQRALQKVINSIISQVDSITMSAVYAAITQTFNVTTAGATYAWDNTTPTFLRDILRAKAVIVKLNLGYRPNVLGLNDTQYAYLMSDEKFTNALSRETTDNPVYTGEVERVAGLTIVVSPAITNPIVADSTQLGFMADEMDGAVGYSVADLAVQVKSIRNEDTDSWDLQGRRKTVPGVQEPGAGIELINTNLIT